MTAKPLWGNVLIQPIEQENVTSVGIQKLGNQNKAIRKGIIFSIEYAGELDVASGDEVFYRSYNTEEVMLDGEKYLLVDQKDVVVVL